MSVFNIQDAAFEYKRDGTVSVGRTGLPEVMGMVTQRVVGWPLLRVGPS